ncbi:hypothetical protein LMH73_017830 [Vibrio splendidus]|nr:hypothetical protein [Vibrio splendidus]MCC4881543.1 hypothetical protein [Vibrio splendidus]
MNLKLSVFIVALSSLGLWNLFSKYQVDDSIKSAIFTYEDFLSNPKNVNLDDAFLPQKTQINMLQSIAPTNASESMFIHLMDTDNNESLHDLKSDFAINMSECTTFYTKNISQPEFTSFANRSGVSVVLHQINCPSFTLESLLFIKEIESGEHKLYKSSFIGKKANDIAKD